MVLPAAISVGLKKWVKEKVKEKVKENDDNAAGDSNESRSETKQSLFIQYVDPKQSSILCPRGDQFHDATGQFYDDDSNTNNTWSFSCDRSFLMAYHIHILNTALYYEIEKTGVLLFLNIDSKVCGNSFF